MSTSSPPAPISFAGTISKQDFSRVQSLLLPVWARWYVFVPCVVYLFVSFGVGWSAAISNPRSAAPDLVFAGLVLLASAVITKYGRAKAWRNTVALVGGVRGVASEHGIEWATTNTTSTFEWEKFFKVRQDAGLSLAYYSPRCAFYFPRDFFASEQDWQAFNAMLLARVAK